MRRRGEEEEEEAHVDASIRDRSRSQPRRLDRGGDLEEEARSSIDPRVEGPRSWDLGSEISGSRIHDGPRISDPRSEDRSRIQPRRRDRGGGRPRGRGSILNRSSGRGSKILGPGIRNLTISNPRRPEGLGASIRGSIEDRASTKGSRRGFVLGETGAARKAHLDGNASRRKGLSAEMGASRRSYGTLVKNTLLVRQALAALSRRRALGCLALGLALGLLARHELLVIR